MADSESKSGAHAPRAGWSAELGWRLLVTVAALAAYELLFRLPLPTVDVRDRGLPGWEIQTGVGLLGITPFLWGFLAVELLSLLLPPGRRLRRGGFTGRRRLTQLSLGLGLLIAAIQASSWVGFLGGVSNPDGTPVLVDPGAATRFLTTVTLTAGSAAALGLAGIVTRLGVGNGVAWILCYHLVAPEVPALVRFVQPGGGGFGRLFTLLAMVALVLLVVFHLRWRARYTVAGAGQTLEVAAVPFPQGVLPIEWAFLLSSIPYTLASRLDREWSPPLAPAIEDILVVAILVPLLSLLGWNLFSNLARLRSSLGAAVSVESDYEAAGRRQLVRALVVLLVVALSFPLLELVFAQDGPPVVRGATALLLLTVLGFDLGREIRFRAQQPGAAVLCELDNVHLASFLEADLASRGIPTLVRAWTFRSTGFFFQPLVKMTLLVAGDRHDEARQRLTSQEIETV